MASLFPILGPSPTSYFSVPVHEEAEIPIPFSEWIERIEGQTTNIGRLKAIKSIPVTKLSTEEFATTLWSVRLKNCFKFFNMREMGSIMKWLNRKVEHLVGQADVEATAAPASGKRILFEAFKDSLKEKDCLGEFSEKMGFLFVDAYLP
jgi:hypothetical protein